MNKMYDYRKERCCIQEGDILIIEGCKILFTVENNKQVAKLIHNGENISYSEDINYDEMFTDLILNNPQYDITIERDNEILFELKSC